MMNDEWRMANGEWQQASAVKKSVFVIVSFCVLEAISRTTWAFKAQAIIIAKHASNVNNTLLEASGMMLNEFDLIRGRQIMKTSHAAVGTYNDQLEHQ